MIAQTERWRLVHKAAQRHIEAAACAIRIKALRDALEALQEDQDWLS
jgi:hypothetical protein